MERSEEEVQKDIDVLKINLPLETKVIVKSANNDPYEVGVVTGYTLVSKSERPMVIVTLDDGREVMPFGICRKCDKRVTRALDKLTGEEQWNVMAKNYIIGE